MDKLQHALFRQSEAERLLCARLLEVEKEKERIIENREVRNKQFEAKKQELEDLRLLRKESDLARLHLMAEQSRQMLEDIHETLTKRISSHTEVTPEPDVAIDQILADRMVDRLDLLAIPPQLPGASVFVPGFVVSCLLSVAGCGVNDIATRVASNGDVTLLSMPIIAAILSGVTDGVPEYLVNAVNTVDGATLDTDEGVVGAFVSIIRAIETQYNDDVDVTRGVLCVDFPANKFQATMFHEAVQPAPAPTRFTTPTLPAWSAVAIVRADFSVVLDRFNQLPEAIADDEALPELTLPANSAAVEHVYSSRLLDDLATYYDTFFSPEDPLVIHEDVHADLEGTLASHLTTYDKRAIADGNRHEWAQQAFAEWQETEAGVCPELIRHIVKLKEEKKSDDTQDAPKETQKEKRPRSQSQSASRTASRTASPAPPPEVETGPCIIKLNTHPVPQLDAVVTNWRELDPKCGESLAALEATVDRLAVDRETRLKSVTLALDRFIHRSFGQQDSLASIAARWNDIPPEAMTVPAVAAVFQAMIADVKESLVDALAEHTNASEAAIAASVLLSGTRCAVGARATGIAAEVGQTESLIQEWKKDVDSWHLDHDKQIVAVGMEAIRVQCSRIVAIDDMIRRIYSIWTDIPDSTLSCPALTAKDSGKKPAKGETTPDAVEGDTQAMGSVSAGFITEAVCPAIPVVKGKESNTPAAVAAELAVVFEEVQKNAKEAVDATMERVETALANAAQDFITAFEPTESEVTTVDSNLRAGVRAVIESFAAAVRAGQPITHHLLIEPVDVVYRGETIASAPVPFTFDPSEAPAESTRVVVRDAVLASLGRPRRLEDNVEEESDKLVAKKVRK